MMGFVLAWLYSGGKTMTIRMNPGPLLPWRRGGESLELPHCRWRSSDPTYQAQTTLCKVTPRREASTRFFFSCVYAHVSADTFPLEDEMKREQSYFLNTEGIGVGEGIGVNTRTDPGVDGRQILEALIWSWSLRSRRLYKRWSDGSRRIETRWKSAAAATVCVLIIQRMCTLYRCILEGR